MFSTSQAGDEFHDMEGREASLVYIRFIIGVIFLLVSALKHEISMDDSGGLSVRSAV